MAARSFQDAKCRMKNLIVIAMLWSLLLLPKRNQSAPSSKTGGKYCAPMVTTEITEFGLKKGAPEDVYKASEGKTVEQIFKVITEGGQWMRGFEKKMTDSGEHSTLTTL